jgi:hypothetical protein
MRTAIIALVGLALGSIEASATTKKQCEDRHLDCAATCGSAKSVNVCLSRCANDRQICTLDAEGLSKTKGIAAQSKSPTGGLKPPASGKTGEQTKTTAAPRGTTTSPTTGLTVTTTQPVRH